MTQYESFDYSAGKVSRVVDENGNVTEVTYDEFGRETSIHEDVNNTPVPQLTNTYGDSEFLQNGLPVSMVRSQVVDHTEAVHRFKTEYSYQDGWGRELQTRHSRGVANDFLVISRRFAAGGSQPSWESAPFVEQGFAYTAQTDGPATVRHRDGLSRVVRVEFPDGREAQISYTPWTAHIEDSEDISDAAGAQFVGTGTTVGYDHKTRIESIAVVIRHGAGLNVESVASTLYQYDGAGRLIEIVDNNGTSQTFDHDSRGEVVRIAHPNGGEQLRLFAADGTKAF